MKMMLIEIKEFRSYIILDLKFLNFKVRMGMFDNQKQHGTIEKSMAP